MTTYIVDTHALVWFLEKNSRLSDNANTALADANTQIILPTIVLTEVIFLYAKKKISINLSAVLSQVANSSNCIVYPLDEEVVSRIPTGINIHDAIIVATGLVFKDLMGHDVAIVTKDELIKQSNLIRTVW
ncbi:MAG: PIN domain-containing protein [Nitrospirae bacterium]|nr:PIN domain-containing protein [Nitrospirota bacterium]